MKSLFENGRIDSELTPLSWSRFGDNVQSLARSYAPNNVERALLELEGAIDNVLAASPEMGDVRSGTLFQLVVGCINRQYDESKLTNYTIVESDELKTLFGVGRVPKPFDYDQ
jgi:hypothetical protein